MTRLLHILSEPEVLGFLGLLAGVMGLGLIGWALLLHDCHHDNCRIRLDLIGINIKTKPKKHMLELTLNFNKYAELRFVPRDLEGKLVNLDPGALRVSPITTGDGAEARILSEAMVIIEGQMVRVFTAAFIPPTATGDYAFALEGDAEPGEGMAPLREELLLKARPPQAVTFGLSDAINSFVAKDKAALPPAAAAAAPAAADANSATGEPATTPA